MKKVLSLLFAIIITTGIFSGCQQSATDTGSSEASTSSKTETAKTNKQSQKLMKVQFKTKALILF